MKEFEVGDCVIIVGNTKVKHHFKIGDMGIIEHHYDTHRCYVKNIGSDGDFQIVHVNDLELIVELEDMAHNNGDLIKVQVGRDDYDAPIYNLFVKFGEFYYNLSSPKQMRGAKNLPKGTKHTVGTMSGTGDHMLAAIEGQDSEVSDSDIPFDDGHHFAKWLEDEELKKNPCTEIVGISSGSTTGDAPMTATEIEMRNAEAIERLKAFQKAYDASGLKTTSEYAEKVKADKYL